MAVFTGLGSAAAPSITFSADTNTGMFSPGADQVAVSTGGTGRLFVAASGNVGIGTTAPSNTLTVAGNIGLTSAGNTITTSATQLTLVQTGDTFGTSSFSLQNRTGSAGALYSNSSLDLVDFGFKPMTGPQSNLRLEH